MSAQKFFPERYVLNEICCFEILLDIIPGPGRVVVFTTDARDVLGFHAYSLAFYATVEEDEGLVHLWAGLDIGFGYT